MMSDPIDACGMRARIASTSAAVVIDRVRTPIARQHPVARVLKRQMKVRRKASGSGDEIDDLGRAVHRLERADPKERSVRHGLKPGPRAQRVGENAACSSSQRPKVRVRSRPYDPRWTPVNAISLKPAPPRARPRRARRRIGTLLGRPRVVGMMQYEHCFGAAGLHPQRERRSAGNAGLEDGTASPLSLAETIRAGRRGTVESDARSSSRLVVVRNDTHHIWQVGDLVGPTGRVAAGDNNPGGWIDSRNAPDGLARRLIGACRDRTRVHDDDVGFFGCGGDRAVRPKAFLDAQRIGLVDAAAEGDHGVLHELERWTRRNAVSIAPWM